MIPKASSTLIRFLFILPQLLSKSVFRYSCVKKLPKFVSCGREAD